jgi:hypothetical protein
LLSPTASASKHQQHAANVKFVRGTAVTPVAKHTSSHKQLNEMCANQLHNQYKGNGHGRVDGQHIHASPIPMNNMLTLLKENGKPTEHTLDMESGKKRTLSNKP